MNKVLAEIFSWVKTIGISLVLALLINVFVFQSYKVDGSSMEPTYEDTERVFIVKLPFSYSYGDVVVIDSRVEHERGMMDEFTDHAFVQLIKGVEVRYLWIKRVVGLPGDHIKIEHGELYRNGELIQESYINEKMYDTPTQEWVVPEEHVFVLGDNRNRSRDSRAVGPIPYTNVVGKTIFSR